MADFDIITDSPVNLPDNLIEAWRLKVLSLEFIVDGQTFKAYDPERSTDHQQFYSMMREGKLVQTSLANLQDADKLLRDSFEAGRDILYLGFDSALSGNFDNVSKLFNRVWAEEYPQRQLRCVDTLAAALGQGLLVTEVVKRRDMGYSLDEAADWAEANRLTVAHWFTVDELKYLQRGGRLSRGAAMAGTLLNIKPILHVDELGRLVPVAKVRGRKQSLQALFEHLDESMRKTPEQLPVYISQADCYQDAQYLSSMILARYPSVEILVNELDPVIGAHSGPGTVALFFLTDTVR